MKKIIILTIVLLSTRGLAEIKINKVSDDLSERYSLDTVWKQAGADTKLDLMGQPMAQPMPKKTETAEIKVSGLHDGKWIALRLKWKCPKPEAGGKLATFSDAVAVEFPIKNNELPPPIFMGAKGDPVHMFHWRYQYQIDEEKGKPTVQQIYPNKTADMYPLEYKVEGNIRKATQEEKDSFVGGTAAGNPQSFQKSSIDEIFAEGFGTSSVAEVHKAKAKGFWKNGEWTVYITRPLAYDNGSKLYVGKKSHIGLAVWQGGKKEVGSLKSITMPWAPIILEEK